MGYHFTPARIINTKELIRLKGIRVHNEAVK